MTRSIRHLATAAALVLGTTIAHAQVTVKDAWVRATVPQQKATGAFMQITSNADTRLVSVSSPLTPMAEVHEMAMDNNVMRMRQVTGIDLPAGRTVELKPGGYHVMLMDLKQQVKAGESVPLTLVFENKAGQRETVQVTAPVRPLNATGAGGQAGHGSGHKH